MTDHLTNAILAASRLDDASAVAHLATHLGATGYGARKLLREFPLTLPALLVDRPSLRAAVERASGIAFDDAEAVVPFPPLTVTASHVATLGSVLTSPPLAFDDSPDVMRTAGILGGWIDPAAEARRDVAAKARALMAAGDLAGAVGVLVASYDANGSPVEGT